MRVYGIKTCGSVKKALAFLKSKGVAYEFVDITQTPPTKAQLEIWLQDFDICTLLNHKGRTYHTLGLKTMNLDLESQKEWLLKEPKLFKRPIIEKHERAIMVGFDEARLCQLIQES